MDRDALRAAIVAQCPPELLLGRDTAAIAVFMSLARTCATDAEIGNGMVLEVLGIERGNALLDLIAADSDLRHVRPLLEQGRLRVASNLVAEWLQGLVGASQLTQQEADAITAIGLQPDPVSEFDVRCACWSESGEWLV